MNAKPDGPKYRNLRTRTGVDDRNLYHREWRRICGRAGAGRRALKDLRDSYAGS